MKRVVLIFLLGWNHFITGMNLTPSDSIIIDSLNTSFQKSTSTCDQGAILMDLVEVLYKYDKDTVPTLCNKAIEIIGETNDSLCLKVLGTAYNNLGVLNDDFGHILEAIKAYEKSILVFEQIGDTKGIATAYTNIGYIYKNLGELSKCLKFNKKALFYRKLLGNERSISNSLNNIGYVFKQQGNLDSALFYYQSSFELRKKIDYKRGMAFSLNNLGAIYKDKMELDKSLDYFKQALELHKATNSVVSNTLTNIGEIYYKQGDLASAKNYADSAMQLALESKMPERVQTASELSYMVYAKLKAWKKAYSFQRLYYEMLDSVASQSLHDELILEEARFRFIRDHIQDSLDFVQKEMLSNKLHRAELESERKISFYEMVGILILILIVLLLVIAYRIKRSSELNLNNKNKQITSSINYAKKIQTAVLKYNEEDFSKLHPHFVVYKPKDIVSGDFYQFIEVNDDIYITVGDCSGHGVPGGFLSMLGVSMLNEIITIDNGSPADILNRLSSNFVKVLNQQGRVGDNFDGMDIILVKINAKNQTFEWAGANRPLIIIDQNKNIRIEKPDIGSIGFFGGVRRFNNRDIAAEKGDMIYLFSDGYTDQFGGDSDKKIGYKMFSEKLSEIAELNEKEQKQFLINYFNNWKGNEEQLDDVCVVGVRI